MGAAPLASFGRKSGSHFVTGSSSESFPLIHQRECGSRHDRLGDGREPEHTVDLHRAFGLAIREPRRALIHELAVVAHEDNRPDDALLRDRSIDGPVDARTRLARQLSAPAAGASVGMSNASARPARASLLMRFSFEGGSVNYQVCRQTLKADTRSINVSSGIRIAGEV